MTGEELNKWTDVNCSQNNRNSSVISVASQKVLELEEMVQCEVSRAIR